MDAVAFRADFPEFANATLYTDGAVNFWLGVGAKLLRPERWYDLLDVGLELFAAHNLSLERAAAAQGAGGGAPGQNSGVISSKTVDKLSVTYDSSVGIVADAGHWNLTTYGVRLLSLINLAGMGGTQIGAGAAGFPPGQAYVYGGAYGPGWPYGY